MAMLSDQLIEEVLRKADIAEVIAHYLPLTKSGRHFKSVCPFHDDHDPSMSIHTEKQIYKCFVCNAGGNAFSFVQAYEHVGFVEAVRKVAEICHLDADIPIIQTSANVRVAESTRILHKILQESIQFCSYQLLTPQGKEVVTYLHNRGIDDDCIAYFQLGYHPFGGHVLYDFLKAKGYLEEDMVRAGICKVASSGMEDVFEGRIMFPIHDGEGNPIAFSARTLPQQQDDKRPKYINSAQSELYNKSSVLYNAHRSKTAARANKAMYIVEGPLDVIALYRCKALHAVATMGTSFTNEHAQQLKRMSSQQILCYDGDKAGQLANYKAGKRMQEMGMSFRIVRNESTLDPDEIIKEHGMQELAVMLETPQTWMEFLFQYLPASANLANYSENKEFAVKMMQEIEAGADAFDKQVYKARLSNLTGFDAQALEKAMPTNVVNKNRTAGKTISVKKRSRIEIAENIILSQMLQYPQAATLFESKLGFLIHEPSKVLALSLLTYYRVHAQMHLPTLLQEINNDSALQTLVFELEESEWLEKEYNEKALLDAFHTILVEQYDQMIDELKQQANKIQNPQRKAALLQEVIALNNKKKGAVS